MARYGGYVPGGKFRHSDTFARLTQDAKGMVNTVLKLLFIQVDK